MLFLNRWGPALLWMVVIYSFSANSDPFQVVPQNITLPDEIIGRIAHVFEFAILAILISRAQIKENDNNSISVPRITIFATSYGIFDELHQSWIPERAFQLLDLGLDILGVLIGLSLFALYKSRV